MLDLFKEIDFSKELKENPKIEPYLKQKAKEIFEETSETIKKPVFDKQILFNNFVLVVNLPQAPKEKLGLLNKVMIEKVLLACQVKDNLKSLEWAYQPDGTTSGYAIFEFDSVEKAEEAAVGLHEFKFGSNVLKAYVLSDFDRFFDIPDVFSPPVNLEKKELYDWCQEYRKKQFCIKIGNQLYPYSYSHLEGEPSQVLQQQEFIELKEQYSQIEWSQNGTYLIEYLSDGFQLYGGSDFKRLSFFKHQGVKNVDFSPCENYVLSFNGTMADQAGESTQDDENYIVWHVGEVSKLRTFKAKQSDIFGTFKWNYDGQYLGRVQDHVLSIYKLPEMDLLADQQGNKSSIKIRNIQKFYWSTKQNIIIGCSYSGNLREHDKQVSTRISMFEIPSRRELKWRNFNTESSNIELYPSANGQYICAIIKKIKNKKVSSYTLQVANLKNKGLMEITEIEINEKVHNYVVEPNSGRIGFVFRQEEQRGETNTMIFHSQIYQVEEENKSFAIKEVGRFNNRNTNEIMLSSNGTFFVLINKDLNSAHCGILETGFTRKEKGKYVNEFTKNISNLSYMDYASFDASGLYIITASKKTKTYQIWTAYGEQLYKDTITDVQGYQSILWRPYFKDLLDEKKIAEIEFKFKEFKKIYEDEDLKITNKKEWERKERREKLKKEFLEYVNKKRQEYQESRYQRIQLLGFDEDAESDLSWDEFIENERVINTQIIDLQEDQDNDI